MNIRRIALSLLIVGLAATTAIGLSSAFFSDTETSEGNILQAGAIDLLLNGGNNTSSIVNFTDLKPGDDYIQEKTLRVNTNDAYVWMHIKDLESSQGTQTEPEDEEEAQNGVQHNIEDYLTYDLTIQRPQQDDEVLISFEHGSSLPDVTSCWIPLGIIPGDVDVAVLQSFHFPSEVTNWAQGDILNFTEEFYAVQTRNNEDAAPPERDRVWNPDTKRCEDVQIACVVKWADEVVTSSQGLRKNGTGILTDRTDPLDALIAESLGTPSDTPVLPGTFFSLGWHNPLTAPTGGSIVVKFNNPFYNQPGVDLKIYEVTGGTYPDELIDVYVSSDNAAYTQVADNVARDEDIDIGLAGVTSARYVKVIDVSPIAPFESTADAYDLDGIQALCGTESD